MNSWLAELTQRALQAINESSLPVLVALFLVTTLTEFGVPFPFVQDTIFYYIGFQAGAVQIRVIPILLVMVLGRLFGASAVFWLAYFVGNPFIEWFARRFRSLRGNLVRLRGDLSVGTRAPVVVTIARLVPGLLLPVTLASGAIRLSFWHFVIGVLAASVVDDGTTIASGVITRLGVRFFGITPSPWLFVAGFLITSFLVWLIPTLLFGSRHRF